MSGVGKLGKREITDRLGKLIGSEGRENVV